MKLQLGTGATLIVAAILTAGCVTTPQKPVSLSNSAIGTQAGRVGVAMTALPQPAIQLPGASCLLCIMAASAANSSLSDHAKTLPYEDLPKLKEMVTKVLRNKGTDAVVINDVLDIGSLPDSNSREANFAKKDFSPLQQKYKIDKILVIDINGLGFIRTYSSYFPTSDPKSLLQGTSYIVNLKNNAYEWYLPVLISRSADMNWDEPPNFPGLTNAYFQSLELGKDSILRTLENGGASAKASAAANTAPASDTTPVAVNSVRSDRPQ